MTGAILDHLWQSTLLALAVGLLTLLFRNARAAVRHGLWVVASVKFLVPFAVLEAMGRVLAPQLRAQIGQAPQAALIARAADPFSQAIAAPPVTPAAAHLDLMLLLALVWGLGMAAVLASWIVRWARLRRALRSTTPLALPAPMPVLGSPSLIEPGLVGLWRPILLVPDSLFEHLSQSEIDAIVAHEASHLRRRDNLIAAIHMLVEALFWFHPMVWWIGARLIEERERACDEAVVAAGHDRLAYARALVECCRLYLRSPLPCAAGASGAVLPTRVDLILNAPPSARLESWSKTMLAMAATCALAAPLVTGWLTSPEVRQAAARMIALASPASGGMGEIASPNPRFWVAPRTTDARHGSAKTSGADPASSASQITPTEPVLPGPIPTAAVRSLDPLGPVASRLPDVHAVIKVTSSADASGNADQVLCAVQGVTGSRFMRRVCMTAGQWQQQQLRIYAAEQAWRKDPSSDPPAGYYW